MELDYRKIGNRIGARRRFLDFGQEQLAQMVKLSKTHISNIENGKSIPSLESIVRLADALETTPDAFLLGIERDQTAADYRTLAAQIKSCGEQEQRLISIIVEAVAEKHLEQK